MFVNKCNTLCVKIERGECEHLTVDEIKEELDNTDWGDLDKGEVMALYLGELNND